MGGDRIGNPGTIVCDLDGVLYHGTHGVPGAGTALRRMADAGLQLLFATNNAALPPGKVAANIAERTGFRPAEGAVVTSSMAAAHHLAGSVGAAFTIGGEGVPLALWAVGIEVVEDPDAADVVVVGIDPQLTYARLGQAMRPLLRGARFVATNDDPTLPTADGLLPGAGAIVAALERAVGRRAEVCGKPHRPMGAMLDALVAGAGVLMVGDRIDTDIDFGRNQGWQTALVLSGVTLASEASASGADFVVGSIAELPDVLGV